MFEANVEEIVEALAQQTDDSGVAPIIITSVELLNHFIPNFWFRFDKKRIRFRLIWRSNLHLRKNSIQIDERRAELKYCQRQILLNSHQGRNVLLV